MCLTPVEAIAPEEIRALRLRENASQAVFARYQNVTTGLVSQWERGASLKLLAPLLTLGGANLHRERRVITVLIVTGGIATGIDRRRQMSPQGVTRPGNWRRTRCCNGVDCSLDPASGFSCVGITS